MSQFDPAGKSVLAYGCGKSGQAAVRLLLAKGAARVVLADDKPSEAGQKAAADLGVRFVAGQEQVRALLPEVHGIIKSPGIASEHPVIEEARSRSIDVLGELELAWLFRPERTKVLAITGTNGKTTTTAWAAHLLRGCGKSAFAVGNIGRPFAEAVLDPECQTPGTIFVVEASSFQLDDIHAFSADAAIMTNFTPDHLDRYGTLEAYYESKQRIWKNMGAESLLVVNGDADNLRAFALGAQCKVGHFFGSGAPEGDAAAPAAYCDGDGMIWLRNSPVAPDAVPLLPARDLALPGPHNLENGLAAALAASVFLEESGVQGLVAGLKRFGGVPHRIEACGQGNGVRFFNDSKATNVDATEKALRSFPPKSIVLIAGGRDKHSDYSAIAALVAERVRVLVTLGEAAPLIEAAWGPPVTPSIIRANSMAEAVELAAAAAIPGNTVLLSPACASFDMYKNYEERGEDFKNEVTAYLAMQTL